MHTLKARAHWQLKDCREKWHNGQHKPQYDTTKHKYTKKEELLVEKQQCSDAKHQSLQSNSNWPIMTLE